MKNIHQLFSQKIIRVETTLTMETTRVQKVLQLVVLKD